MENPKNNNSSLKAVIAVLAVLLVGSLVYIFKLSSDSDVTKTELTTTLTEKESVMKDLQELKATYDAAIAENTSMSDELIQERDKVVALMDDLNKSKGDVSKYRSQVQAMQSKMKTLVAENDELKKQNGVLTTQRDSTIVVLGESKKYNEVLVGQNEELAKTVEKGSKLSVLNTKTYTAISAARQLLDANPAFAQGGEMQVEVTGRDKMVQAAIFGELTKNLEASKTALLQETPTIQVVDNPEMPLKKNEVSWILALLAGAFIGKFITALYLFVTGGKQ